MVKNEYHFKLLGVPPAVSELLIEFDSTTAIADVILQLRRSYFLTVGSKVTLAKDTVLLDEDKNLDDYALTAEDIIKVLPVSRQLLYEQGWFTHPEQSVSVADINVQEKTEDIPNNEDGKFSQQ